MNKFIRRLSAVIAVGACTLVGATAAPTMLQSPPFPCNRACGTNVSLTPSTGICATPGGGCGQIGIRVSVYSLGGQCTPVGGGCAFQCTFKVTLDYDNSGSCACTTVTGTECGNTFAFNCLPACIGGPCPLQANQDLVSCGSSCNLSYTVTEAGSTQSCSVTGTLTCGDHTCP
jgi:hypothetical protein